MLQLVLDVLALLGLVLVTLSPFRAHWVWSRFQGHVEVICHSLSGLALPNTGLPEGQGWAHSGAQGVNTCMWVCDPEPF